MSVTSGAVDYCRLAPWLRLSPQPPSDTVLLPGDVINAIGTPSTLGRLESLFDTRAQPA